jgi:response regulator RpfG family c-di-GMP phosphodiesterase
MSNSILCVDDEPDILQAYQRQFRKTLKVVTACGGPEGLEKIRTQGPFGVIVSDLRMPGMDGIEFLTKAGELSPDTVRIMLTGQADLHAAMEAVNRGHIFRFLAKPCPPAVLADTMKAGLEQYRLITAEKELLEKTLSGSLKVLCDVLSLVNPEAFGRSARVTGYVERLASQMGETDLWAMRTAAMLSQIGCVILPEEILKKVYRREQLSANESQLFDQHPCVAADLLRKIPRMEQVADIILYQEKYFDGYGVPRDGRKGEEIPLGSRILKVALDYDALESVGTDRWRAFEQLKDRKGWYDPAVLEALKTAFADDIKYESRAVMAGDLASGMVIAEDVLGVNDALLVTKGQEITPSLLLRLQNIHQTTGVKQPIAVLIPIRSGDSIPVA